MPRVFQEQFLKLATTTYQFVLSLFFQQFSLLERIWSTVHTGPTITTVGSITNPTKQPPLFTSRRTSNLTSFPSTLHNSSLNSQATQRNYPVHFNKKNFMLHVAPFNCFQKSRSPKAMRDSLMRCPLCSMVGTFPTGLIFSLYQLGVNFRWTLVSSVLMPLAAAKRRTL